MKSFSLPKYLTVLPLLSLAALDVAEASTVPLVKRFKLTDEHGTFDSKLYNAHISHIQSKFRRGLDAYERNTGSVHPSDSMRPSPSITKRAGSGSDPLLDFSNQLWSGNISVGTPPVSYRVDFDTGSSDLFLPGKDCDSTCQGHVRYDTSKSSTAKDLHKNFSLSFGDGSTVQGDQFNDTVEIVGMKATGQAVGAAKQYSQGFERAQFPPDGLMGMAWPQISVFQRDPVFHTLVAQGKTNQSVFGVKLGSGNGTSELTIGAVNNSLIKGGFTHKKVTQQGFWQVDLDSVNTNGSPAVKGLSAIIDTGTSLVVGIPADVDKLYAAIPGAKNASATVGQGMFTLPCANIPDVGLVFGGKEFKIPATSFNLGTLSQGSDTCVGGIVGGQLGDFWVVGDVFLQGVYAEFDVGNSQVGFAELA
ncbi:hypothetical protein PLICRDRAFT_170472 [Plicaturopsis crispa FD-325 SS-3]|nr:hypothetical protein PLICRDRAFT_170472 [Plicaturopsis crispa FD-325 SS-3]